MGSLAERRRKQALGSGCPNGTQRILGPLSGERCPSVQNLRGAISIGINHANEPLGRSPGGAKPGGE